MKTQKLNKKLVLNKSTVSDLSADKMERAKAGLRGPVATFSMLVLCFVCESDADPCQTVATVCPCNDNDPGSGDLCGPSRYESACVLC